VNGVAEVVDFFLGLGGASLERVADEIKLTPAVVASRDVDTDSIDSADVGRTFIQVVAAAVGVAGVALAAGALRDAGGEGAGRVGAALNAGARWLVQLLAAGVGVASKALVTDAAIGRSIFAVTVGSATGGARRGSDRRHAEELGVADESLPADAGLGVGVAVGVQAAGLSSTSVNASSRFADLVASRTGTSH